MPKGSWESWEQPTLYSVNDGWKRADMAMLGEITNALNGDPLAQDILDAWCYTTIKESSIAFPRI